MFSVLKLVVDDKQTMAKPFNSTITADTSLSIEPHVTAAEKIALIRESRNVK